MERESWRRAILANQRARDVETLLNVREALIAGGVPVNEARRLTLLPARDVHQASIHADH